MKEIVIILSVLFILAFCGIGLFDVVLGIFGGIIGLIAGLIGGAIGLIIGVGAILFVIAIPFLIIGAVVKVLL